MLVAVCVSQAAFFFISGSASFIFVVCRIEFVTDGNGQAARITVVPGVESDGIGIISSGISESFQQIECPYLQG